MVAARWGMPTPPSLLKPGQIDRGVTNIRNTSSAHWRGWLKPANRCLVPATSFCEPTDLPGPDGKKIWTWFALSDDRPLFAFAGLWCNWRGIRGTKKSPEEGEHQLPFLFVEHIADTKRMSWSCVACSDLARTGSGSRLSGLR